MPSLGITCIFLLTFYAVSSRAHAHQPAQPTPGTASSPATTQSAASTKITNARVVEMTKLGLDDDIIVARIKHGICEFQLSDTDLVELKKSGVSSKVVTAMLDTVPVTAPVAPMPTPEPSDGRVRVFVTDSQSWETRGSSAAGGNSNSWGASSSFSGGARPQTAEIIKTLNQRCPELTVTNILGKADFVMVLDHEGGKGVLRHRNKVAILNHNEDGIFSDSTRELGNAVKDASEAMMKTKKGGSVTLNAERVNSPAEIHAATTPMVDSTKESVTSGALTNSSQKSVGWIGAHAQNKGDVAVVTSAAADCPAEQPGIQVGDIIVALDGRLIKGKDFETTVAALKPGTRISVNYARGPEAHEVWLTVSSQN